MLRAFLPRKVPPRSTSALSSKLPSILHQESVLSCFSQINSGPCMAFQTLDCQGQFSGVRTFNQSSVPWQKSLWNSGQSYFGHGNAGQSNLGQSQFLGQNHHHSQWQNSVRACASAVLEAPPQQNMENLEEMYSEERDKVRWLALFKSK